MSNPKLVQDMRRIIQQNGTPALKKARREILRSFKDDSDISQALQHFSKITLRGALPVFPALIAVACEASGGNPEKTIPFGEAVVLITGAADLHDDIIDHSLTKGSKQTVFGKFGANVTLLAGDALLVKGLALLDKACEELSPRQSLKIKNLVAEAVFEICTAETLELRLRSKNLELTPDEYNEVIRRKAVVPELFMKMGAIIGNSNPEQAKKLGKFGRTFGIITTVVDEFIDLSDVEELQNRLKNECPPLPVIYALKTPQSKDRLLPLLQADLLSESTHDEILELTLNSTKVKTLQKTLVSSADAELQNMKWTVNQETHSKIEKLLSAPLYYLQAVFST